MDDPPLPPTVADCLLDLAGGDDSARARILELCSERLRLLAHRMLNRFPAVRRWEDTDDVFQTPRCGSTAAWVRFQSSRPAR